MSLTSPALVGRFFTTSATWEAQNPLITGLIIVDSSMAPSKYICNIGSMNIKPINTLHKNSISNLHKSFVCVIFNLIFRL